MREISEIIKDKKITRDHRNTYEFQAYGNRLAEEFNDLKHRALYIKLAKKENRGLLETAREYVLANEKILTKGKLFMWKLQQLKEEKLKGGKK